MKPWTGRVCVKAAYRKGEVATRVQPETCKSLFCCACEWIRKNMHEQYFQHDKLSRRFQACENLLRTGGKESDKTR